MLPQEIVHPTIASGARQRREARPGRTVRLIARLRAGTLDGRLLEGEDPAGSELLAARAGQLTGARHREQLAGSLDGLLRVARRPRRLAAIAPDSSALLANEEAVRNLAARLDSRRAVYARGVARVERLLTDAESEVYRGGVSALAEQLAAAAAELDGATGPVLPVHGAPRYRCGACGGRARAAAIRSRSPSPAGSRGSFPLPDGSWLHGRRESS